MIDDAEKRAVWYRLEGETIIPEYDLDAAFAVWYEDVRNRVIAQEHVTAPDGNTYFVSTVFLGFDHRFDGSGPPILFETMIFPNEQYQERYCTRAAAEANHRHTVEMLVARRLSDLLEE